MVAGDRYQLLLMFFCHFLFFEPLTISFDFAPINADFRGKAATCRFSLSTASNVLDVLKSKGIVEEQAKRKSPREFEEWDALKAKIGFINFATELSADDALQTLLVPLQDEYESEMISKCHFLMRFGIVSAQWKSRSMKIIPFF